MDVWVEQQQPLVSVNENKNGNNNVLRYKVARFASDDDVPSLIDFNGDDVMM